MGMIGLAMPVNKRLILLVVSALILAFLTNQVINLAQAGMRLGLQASETEQSTSIMMFRAFTTATNMEAAKESSQLEKVTEETYDGGRERLLDHSELSLLLNLAFSLGAATMAFFLVKKGKRGAFR